MGKRKRRAVPKKGSTSGNDVLANSSQMDALPQQEPSQVANNAATPASSILEPVDDSIMPRKSSHLPIPPACQNRFGRAIFMRNPSLFTRKYSRRNTVGHADAPTSHARVIPANDETVIFKTAKRSRADVSVQRTGSISGGIQTPASTSRLALSPFPLSADVPLHEIGKLCSICQKLLIKKPLNGGNSISPFEPSTVAVLCCGHFSHADCLEEKTCEAERMDPSCPVCRDV
ncbi:hypothetical protein M9H77_00846 [Catharanthus roseus]|uniref:Uncharacterized protein n=1 Tax=Catharanthus roseus TaxID=4058 RepID=A0ACC0C446_CATRO|nr:hypothetical protein M9H77_00846 [Catharanthus roseus]